MEQTEIRAPIIIYLSSFLFLCTVFGLCKFLNKVWRRPIQIQATMRSRGINGPSYKFLHGNTKEIVNMRNISMNNPMELSHDLLPRLQPHIHSWTKLYGKNFLMWYGSRAQLVVSEPELVKEVMTSKEDAYCKVEYRTFMRKLLGDGLILSTGNKWSKVRKVANHAFHGESLKGMVPAMIVGAEMMLERWRQFEGTEIEVFQEFKVLTSEIISRTAFGSSYKEGEKIFDMITRMIRIVARNNFRVTIPGISKVLRSKDDIEADRLQQGIHKAIVNIITEKGKAMTGKSDDFGSDFFGLLLKAYNDPDKMKRISLEELIDECKNFYVAGHETTSSSLTWTVLLLAIHTDWQEKARKEVFEIFDQQSPTADGIGRLKIMSMIINESLRLYPPIFTITRESQREIKLGNLQLPAKMEISIPNLAVQHDPEIWGEDVNIFNPGRFAEGVAKATNNNPSAYLPFGLGPRTCVGLNFAVTEENITLSMILQRYRFTLSPTYVHSPVHMLALNPKHGVQIKIEVL